MEREIEDWKNSLEDQAQFKYYTDPEIHDAIDRVLIRMMKIECNSGDDNTAGENKRIYKRKQMLYYAIKQMDQLFYERIKP